MNNNQEKEPDYKGFGEHVQIWNDLGIPFSYGDLVNLAKKYNTPILTRNEIKETKVE